MSDQPKKPCFAADGKEPIINAGFGYPLMVSAVAFNRQQSRIEADEALMRQALDALEAATSTHMKPNQHRAALTALRKRLESSK